MLFLLLEECFFLVACKHKCSHIKTSLWWRSNWLLILFVVFGFFCTCLNGKKAGGLEKHQFIFQQVKNRAMTGIKARKYLESAQVAFGVNNQEILLTGLPRCNNSLICDELLLYVWTE